MKKRGLMARKKRKSGQINGEAGEVNDSVLATEDEDGNDFEAVLDCDSNALLIVDGESRQVLWVNRSAEKLLRKKKDKLLSEPFPEEIEEGPMRTFDLNKKVHTLTWQGQPAVLLTLSSMSSGASFSTEWRLEAAEERAREAEDLVQELQAKVQALSKISVDTTLLQSLQDHEAELKAELLRCQDRLATFETEMRQADNRAERAEERAREAESLMEEAESQARETERHLEDLSDSVRQVEEQLETTSQALKDETRRAQALEAELAEARKPDSAGLSALQADNEALQAEVNDLIQRIGEQEQMALEASAQVGDREQQIQALKQTLKAWDEKQLEWQQRETEIEEIESVHLQVITELEQLREERQTWQETQDAQLVPPGELEKAQEQLREAQDRLDYLEIERSELEEKLVESRAELEQAGERFSAAEQKLTHQLEQLKEQLAVLEAAQGDGQGQQDQLRTQLEASQAEHTQVYLQLAASQEQLADLQSRLSSSQDECTAVQVELATAHDLAGEAQAELSAAQDQAAAAQADLAAAQAECARLQEQLDLVQGELTQGGAEAERGRLLEEQLSELQLETADLADKNAELASARDALQAQLEELRANTAPKEQLHASQDRLHELEALLLESEQKLQEAFSELALAQQKLHEQGQESSLLEQVRADLEDVQQHLTRVEKERDDLMRRLEVSETALTELRDQAGDTEARLESKEADAEALAAALADLESQLNELQDSYDQLKSAPQVDVGLLQSEWAAAREKLLAEAAESAERQQELQRQSDELLAAREEERRQWETQVGSLEQQLKSEQQQSLALADELSVEGVRLRQLEERLQATRSELVQAEELQAEVARLISVEAEQARQIGELQQKLEVTPPTETQSLPLVASIPAEDPRLLELESLLEQASQFEPEVTRLRELEAAQSQELADLRRRLEELTSAAPLAPTEGSGNKETEVLAFEDNLTRLANFNMLKRYLDFSLKQVDRYQRRCALLHIDLDRFQALNEALGAEAGDEVLRQVAERLQKVVRTSDVLCRKSEDDFLILLSEVAGEADAPESISIVLKRIQEMLSPPIQAAGQPILVSASIGVSQFPSDAEDGDKMLAHAYSAMRRAKELGRNQAQFYTEELQKRHEARAILEVELRKGLEARQFQLLYQPIVHLPTGAIKGVETLLRWAHPSYGLLTPDYFIEVADETGILVPLGRWVILEAAKQLYEWSRQGLDLFVTVNLSTRQFLQADLVDTIRRALETTGAPAHNFVVEVPESVQMIDIQRVQAILLALRQAGIRVALDRFGSGFSSLERLHSELITLLKVDRKFLFHAATNAAALNVTVAALGLARGLRLRPVAVGVENATQLSLCRQLECEYVQGNLVYVPTDAAQIGELARAGRLLR